MPYLLLNKINEYVLSVSTGYLSVKPSSVFLGNFYFFS